MIHHATPDFWERYHKLPGTVRGTADKAFTLLKENPAHRSLHFKKVKQFWSVRVGVHHRALGVAMPDGVLWFWIGTHAEYDSLVR